MFWKFLEFWVVGECLLMILEKGIFLRGNSGDDRHDAAEESLLFIIIPANKNNDYSNTVINHRTSLVFKSLPTQEHSHRSTTQGPGKYLHELLSTTYCSAPLVDPTT